MVGVRQPVMVTFSNFNRISPYFKTMCVSENSVNVTFSNLNGFSPYFKPMCVNEISWRLFRN